MTLERTAAPPPPFDGTSQLETDLRAHVRAAVMGETPEVRVAAVEALLKAVEAIPVEVSAEHKAKLLRALLDDPELLRRTDRKGVPLRDRLVKMQLALGFPHALEVNPDHLPPAPTCSGGSALHRALATGLGLCTFAWSGLWAYGVAYGAMMDNGDDQGPGLGVWLFLAQSLYGAVSMVLPLSMRLARALGGPRTLRVLGWVGVLGPAFAAAPAALSPDDFGLVLVTYSFLGLPAVLTGAVTLRLASTMGDPPG